MIAQLPVNGEDLTYANRLYEFRKRRPEKVRCVVCGDPVRRDLRIKGLTTCSRHNDRDPMHEAERKERKVLPSYLEGPPAPQGTGLQLKAARLDAGLTLEALALEVGCAYSTLGRWERQVRAVSVNAARVIHEAIERMSGE